MKTHSTHNPANDEISSNERAALEKPTPAHEAARDWKERWGVTFRSEPPDRAQFIYDDEAGEVIVRLLDPPSDDPVVSARRANVWPGTVRPVDHDPAAPTAVMAVPLQVFASIGASDAVPITNLATPFPLGANTHVWLSVSITGVQPTVASVETGAGAYAPMIFPEVGTQSALNIPVGCVMGARLPAGQLGFDFRLDVPGESEPRPHHVRQILFMQSLLIFPCCMNGRIVAAAEPYSGGAITFATTLSQPRLARRPPSLAERPPDHRESPGRAAQAGGAQQP